MLNKIFALSLSILILLSLCGCKSETSAEANVDTTSKNSTVTSTSDSSTKSEPESEETESIESNDLLSLGEWQMAYLDYISTRKDNYAFYALVFIDNDNIPELYMSGYNEVTGDSVCSVRNGAIISQQLDSVGGGKYIKKSGEIANQNGSMGVFYTNVYKLDEKGFSQKFSAFSAEVIGTMENGDLKLDYEYYASDKKVDKTAYDKAISDAFNSKKAKPLNENAVTYEEIKEQIENYK